MPISSNLVTRRPSTQDVSWFLDTSTAGQLDLNPTYQRKSVWGPKDRKFFLDTIFRGFPCPPIYLHKTIREGRSLYAVVDGKQRLETVLLFYNNKIALPTNFADSRLDGKRWRQIKDDPESAGLFLNYTFPVEFVELPFNDAAYVNDVFDRLNRNSKILNQQELRHAKYSGWLIDVVEDEVYDPLWSELKVRTKARARRMQDAQFVSELFLLVITKKISGFSQEKLDQLYAAYDSPEEGEIEDEWHLPQIVCEDVLEEFKMIKAKVAEIQRAAESIGRFLTDTKHLYSLWAYLVIGTDNATIPPFNVEKYKVLVANYRTIESSDEIQQGTGWDPDVYAYYDASRGATTEEPQRIKRQEVLERIMESRQ